MSSTRQFLFALITICLSGTVGVVVLEVVFGSWFSTDPWRRTDRLNIMRDRRIEYDVGALRRNPGEKAVYTRDRYGLRGSCGNPEEIEILAVGGSTTDQRYTSDGQTFQDVLASLLSTELHRRVCVSNAGVDGHSTFGHIAAFHDWFPLIPGLHPRFFLFYIGVNDAGFRFGPTRYDSRNAAGLAERIRASISERSALYRLARIVRSRIMGSAAYATHGTSPETWMYVDSMPTPGVGPLIAQNTAAFGSRLDEILTLVRRAHATPICVSQPHLFVRENGRSRTGIRSVFVFEGKTYNGLDYDQSIRAIDSVMQNKCTRDGFFIDAADGPFDRNDFYDPVHMTPAGAAKLGGYLFEGMREQGVVSLLR